SLLFLLRNVRREIFFVSAQSSHETNAVALFHDAGPSVLLDVAPAVEMFHRPRFRIALGWKHEELHLLFHDPYLRDGLSFLVIELTAAERFQIRELSRHIVMHQTMLHKEIIAERARVCLYRVEYHG